MSASATRGMEAMAVGRASGRELGMGRRRQLGAWRWRWLGLTAAATLALTPAVARAQQDLPGAATPTSGPGWYLDLSLEELLEVSVVSARKESLAEAPATLVVITAQQIRERGYLDLVDVFADLPGVDVALFNRQTVPTEIFFRGVNAAFNKIVVLRDGVAVNLPATFPKFGRNLPLHDVQRIEILYGPASVVYGSDAAAAVVQLVTREAVEGAHIDVGLAGGSFDPLRGFDRFIGTGHLAASWRQDTLVLRGSVRTYQSNGPDLLELYPSLYGALETAPAPGTGKFEAPMRGYHVDAEVAFREVTAGVRFTDHAWPSSLAQNPAPPGNFLMSADSIFRYRFLLPYVRHAVVRGPVDLQTVLSWGRMVTDPESILNVGGKQNHQFQYQASLRLDHRTAWTATDWLTATFGLRLQTFDVVPVQFFLPEPVHIGSTNLAERSLGHVVYQRAGAFALADVEPRPGWKLTGGVSYEHDGKSGEDVLLPRAGLVRRLFGGAGYVKVLYGEGFESAIPDVQYLRSDTPTLKTLPNPELKSERVRSVEVRYEHRHRRLLAAEAGAFYNRVTDLQQIVNLGQVEPGVDERPLFQARNIGLVWTAGGEASARWTPAKWLHAAASYALLFGEETLPLAGGPATFDLAKVAMHKVLAEVTVRPFWRLVANARLRWVGDVATRASNSRFHGEPMPGYTHVNLNLRAEDVRPGLDAHLLVENLTDARHYHFGFAGETAAQLPRLPQPGLRLLAGLTYRH